MSVYLAVASSKWGDDYRIYGVCKYKETAITILLSAIPLIESISIIRTELENNDEYVKGNDVYRIEEWQVE